jgi:hypothetical protein
MSMVATNSTGIVPLGTYKVKNASPLGAERVWGFPLESRLSERRPFVEAGMVVARDEVADA